MKLSMTIVCCLLIPYLTAIGQADTTSSDNPSYFNISFEEKSSSTSSSRTDSKRQKRYIAKGNVSIATCNFQLSLAEMEISDFESLECNALLNRDTFALRQLWLIDFTLDAPQNEVGKHSVPYYVSLNRTIEKFTILENIIFTSGHESSLSLTNAAKLEEPKTRRFLHVWNEQAGFGNCLLKMMNEISSA